MFRLLAVSRKASCPMAEHDVVRNRKRKVQTGLHLTTLCCTFEFVGWLSLHVSQGRSGWRGESTTSFRVLKRWRQTFTMWRRQLLIATRKGRTWDRHGKLLTLRIIRRQTIKGGRGAMKWVHAGKAEKGLGESDVPRYIVFVSFRSRLLY